MLYHCIRHSSKDYVIYINLCNHEFSFHLLHKQGLIRSSLSVALTYYELSKSFIPGPRCLFQTIESLLQLVNMIRIHRISKAFWLFHINFFMKIAIQKRTLDIHLVEFEF
ncbi:putative mitochondrial protein [Trifolium repens]|nr:putative mitochondrial protein [Trifolium repens]